MTTEDSEAVEQSQQVSLHFQKMDGWAVLRHQFKGGKFDGVVAVAVMGFLYVPGDPKPKGVVTVLGAETAAQPLMGPYGEVTNDGSVFPSVDEYCEWFEQRAQ